MQLVDVRPSKCGFALLWLCRFVQVTTGMLLIFASLAKLANTLEVGHLRLPLASVYLPSFLVRNGGVILANWEFAVGVAIIFFHHKVAVRLAAIVTLLMFIGYLSIVIVLGQKQCGCLPLRFNIPPQMFLAFDLVSLACFLIEGIYVRHLSASKH